MPAIIKTSHANRSWELEVNKVSNSNTIATPRITPKVITIGIQIFLTTINLQNRIETIDTNFNVPSTNKITVWNQVGSSNLVAVNKTQNGIDISQILLSFGGQ